MDSGVKSVGIAVREHPLQTRVLQHSCYSFYIRFHGGRCEEAVFRQRTLVLILERLLCAVPHFRLGSHLYDELASGCKVFMLKVSFCICLAVEGDVLNVTVLVAVAFGGDCECASIDSDFGLVEYRAAEPVAS